MAHLFTKPDVRWQTITILHIFLWILSSIGVCFGQNPNILCPDVCSCLSSEVDCIRLQLKNLPRNLPSWVTDLRLNSNKLTHLEPDAFANLVHLETLDLSHNKIKNISANAFRGLGHLTELRLFRNRITRFPRFDASLSNLTHLILHHNRIASIVAGDLENLPSLQLLDLSFNRLSTLPTGVFPINNVISEIDFESNEISTLQENCFVNLMQLQVLKLAKNRISELSEGTLTGLRGLKTLDLDENELQVIISLVFRDLVSLEKLTIRQNGITAVNDGAFYNSEEHITHLDLSWNAIPSVAKSWLYGLTKLKVLNLGYNQINETDPEGWNFLEVLEHLNLSNNILETLEQDGFSGLTNLRSLYIDHNQVSDVAEAAFRGLANVETLDLSNNDISWRMPRMTNAFEGLTSIHSLNLANNDIRHLPEDAFTGLESIRKMDLSGNEITTITENAFELLTGLNEMHLNTSSMLCDCKVSWFPQWVRASGMSPFVGAVCRHPSTLEGRNIFDLTSSQMKCKAQPQPYMLTQPKGVEALRGDNVTLFCQAASSSDSPLTVSWRKDGKAMEEADPLNVERSHDDGIRELTSALHLPNIKDTNEGKYTCHFENEFGVAHSKKAKVVVYVFPSFIKKPLDINVRVSDVATLQCSAEGHPTPTIAWKKDGGENFPAAINRRFQVVPESYVFFITDVTKEDMGIYTCTASNAAGEITANITLTVLEDPYFVKPLKPLQVGVGESAIVECHIDGSPAPVITWLKDGERFVESDEHQMVNTDDKHLLIIMSVSEEDEGSYTCMANNSLGFVQDTTYIQVSKDCGGLDGATTTGIIIIAVVFCIVGTSLIWVLIIYQTRKCRRKYVIQHHHGAEVSLPAEIPSTSLNGSSEGTIHQETSSGVSSSATDRYQAENMSDCDSTDGLRRGDPLGLPHHLRTAAIFPSEMDIEDPPEYGICLQHFPDHGILEEEDEAYKELSSASDLNPNMYPQHYPEHHPFLECYQGYNPRCFSDHEDIPLGSLAFKKSKTMGCVGENEPLRSDSDVCQRYDDRSFLSVNAYPYMPNPKRYSRDIASDGEQKKSQKHKKLRFPFPSRKNRKCHTSDSSQRLTMPNEHRNTNLLGLHKPHITEKLQHTKCPPHRKMDSGRRIALNDAGYQSSCSTSQLPTNEVFANNDLSVPVYHSLQKLSTSTSTSTEV